MERDDNKRQFSSVTGAPSHGNHADWIGPWRRIGGQLVALIGESGFCALLGRALRMLSTRYAWLSVDPARKSIDALLVALERDLAGAERASADIANAELLDTFTKQLSTLIGETLTSRLLAEAKVASRAGSDDAQEHK